MTSAPITAADSQYFDDFLAQNQEDMKIDDDFLQKSLNIMPSLNDVDFLIASTEPNGETLPKNQVSSEDFFDNISTSVVDNFNSESIANIQGLTLENKHASSEEKQEDEKQAMVLSLRPGSLGLSNLLGNLDKEQ